MGASGLSFPPLPFAHLQLTARDVTQNLLGKESTLTSSCCFNAQDMREVLAALSAGTIKVDDLITSRIRLEEVFDKGLEVLRSDPSQVKILVQLEEREEK